MNQTSSKVICLNCKAYSKHCTAKCPYVKCRSCGKIGHLINECPDIGYFNKYCPTQKVKPTEIFTEYEQYEEISCSNSTMPVFHSMSYIKQLME